MIQQVLGFSFLSEEPADFSLEQKTLLEENTLSGTGTPDCVSASPHSALERIKEQNAEIKREQKF